MYLKGRDVFGSLVSPAFIPLAELRDSFPEVMLRWGNAWPTELILMVVLKYPTLRRSEPCSVVVPAATESVAFDVHGRFIVAVELQSLLFFILVLLLPADGRKTTDCCSK